MFTYIKPNYITIEGKKYLSFDGHVYPSITRILSATKPEAARQALRRWRQRVGVKQAKQITANACRRGTSLHTAIKYFFAQQTLPDDVDSNQYWHSILPVLEQVEQVHLIESAVYNLKHKYAGCFDCLGDWQGQLCLFDWKTASKPKKREWITDYCLQVTAYITAVNYLYNVNISQGIIAIALADRPAQIFYLDAEALNEYWQQFLIRLQLWQEMQSSHVGYVN